MPKGAPEYAWASTVKVLAEKVTRVRSELLVLGFFQDVRPLNGWAAEIDWIQNGILSRLILAGKIRGVLGEATLLAPQGKMQAQKVLIMGLGEAAQFNDRNRLTVYSRVHDILSHLQIRDCAVELFGPSRSTPEGTKSVEAILRGAKGVSGPPPGLSIMVHDFERAQRIQQYLLNLSESP